MEAADPDVELLLQFDPSFDPPHDCGDERCRDFFPEFIYIVVIPASVALLLIYIVLFSLLACCLVRRKKKRAAETEDQLACYDAVRRASISIRRMSTSNSTPLLDEASRSGSMSLVRNDHRRRGFRPRDSCHSAPGTLQRHHRNRDSASLQDTRPLPTAPPPYGIPQQYPMANEEEVFLGHHRNRDSASLQDTRPLPTAPPPYGIPQQYPMANEEEVFLGPDIPLRDLQPEGQDEAPQNDPHQQPGRHHHHRHHHRHQRPYSAANGYTTH